MNPLSVIRGFDQELYSFFETELEHQDLSLSFIPDENATSPLCAAIMGSVLVSSSQNGPIRRDGSLESLCAQRICQLFNAEHANVRTITIEAASRVVFQSLTRRGDVVMSLDLRKKEHCNSENLAYRFVNFGIDPETQQLNYDEIEKNALLCRPQLIILSPVNYPLNIDYAHFARIAKACGAILWCDISTTACLIAGGVMNSPLPHADVVTFNSHGATQGPVSSVILCKKDIAGAIDRMVISSGHFGLQTSQLAALAARMKEMQEDNYKKYTSTVIDNAKALGEGLKESGMKLLCDGTQTHLIMVDTKNCAISARGAQELLRDANVHTRICTVLTSDPNIKFEAVRFSSLSGTTRGLSAEQFKNLGVAIGRFLARPDDVNQKALKDLVMKYAYSLPQCDGKWLNPQVLENLRALQPSQSISDSAVIREDVHRGRLDIFKKK